MLRSDDFPSRNIAGNRNGPMHVHSSADNTDKEDVGSYQHEPGIARTALALATMLAITIAIVGVKFLVWGPPLSH